MASITVWAWAVLFLNTGGLCQEDVNECDTSPCENGGVCENTLGGYTCVCPSQAPDGLQYGGQNCTVALVGCEDHECQNSATCLPFLSEGHHGYNCLCPAGFTGSNCQTSTTFSFERRGHLLLHTAPPDGEATSNITLSFRTVLPDAVLFRRGSQVSLLSLEIRGGRLRLSLRGASWQGQKDVQLGALELPRNVTDGQWHGAEALLGEGLLTLSLLDADCEGGGPGCEGTIQVDGGPLGPALQHTLVGPGVVGGPGAPSFVGCLRDLFVDSQLVVPEDWLNGTAVNVMLGCDHHDRCQDRPCENRGQCVNLWQAYQCHCQRPYTGHTCSEEYVTARFGHEDAQSYAVFLLDRNPARPDSLSVSLFVRTRRPSGLLLVLSNGTGQYLRVWLQEGLAHAQAHQLEEARGTSRLDDGEVHLLSVSAEGGQLRLAQSGQDGGTVAVETRPVRVQAGDAVHVGGLEEPRGTATLGGYFKGCVQDLRLGGVPLQFFALELDDPVSSLVPQTMSHVMQGCAGDDTCANNPCQNGGVCYSVWDGFSCTCPPSTAGPQCEEVRWCELSPCPPEAVCRALAHGYDCIANMTFQGNTALSYRGSGRIESRLTSIAFSLRTRQQDATILHAEHGLEFVTVCLQDGLLVLQLLSGNASSSSPTSPSSSSSPAAAASFTFTLRSSVPVNDGAWHSVELLMVAPWAEASPWTLLLDNREEVSSVSDASAGGLDFLRSGVDVLLGSLGPEGGHWGLIGCLSTVELGGIALPYHGPDEVALVRSQDERFDLTGLTGPVPQSGCHGEPVCQPEPCLNGGSCHDLFNAFDCSCAPGWAGRRCEVNEDTCASAPCVHGNCTVKGLRYECACPLGYSGANCETEVDVCLGHICANGATCLHGVNMYACLCADNYTGTYCRNRIKEIPWYLEVRKIKPKLPVSFCGDEVRNYTCFNGGNCSEHYLTCDCLPGFTGHRCEQDVDECKSNPCLNGGYCRNMVNKFQCMCEMFYGGDRCQFDVSDIYFYATLLLWQNLFQMLSYLIWRLDDEPEVDWGV